MGAMIDGSVYTGNAAIGTGAYTQEMPDSNLTLVGIASAGIFAISIPISPARNAIIFFASAGGIVKRYFPCNIPVNGQSLNYTVLAGSGNLTFYYGKPDAKAPTAQQLAGVFTSATFSAAGSSAVTVNFPGSIKMTGLALVMSASGTQATATFNTSTGQSLTVSSFSNQVGSDDTIIPLDNLPAANALSITLYSFAAQTVYLVAYYQ